METGTHLVMSEALARLWARFLPEILERVRVLESAGAALGMGTLGADERTAAAAAAHKLAGVLGTFGLAEGTALAREAEVAYSGIPASDAARVARLQQIARQLEDIIGTRG
jgi:HPt (histidine-containing phosphotransfer) domain-containing protein